MRHFIRTAFTSRDNASADIGRIIWAFFSCALITDQTYAMIAHHQPFDAMAFAGAASALMAAGGFGLALKNHTEPECFHADRPDDHRE